MATTTKKRKEVEDPNNTWNMQLVAAVLRHDVEGAGSLLEKGADINHVSADGNGVQLTPMQHVILHGGCDEPTLEWIAVHGGNGSATVNKTHGSIFHYLAATEALDVLDKVASIAARHRKQGTALGASLDINARDATKSTACGLCIHNNRPDIARILIMHGCYVPFSDLVTAKYTALARACVTGDINAAETLLACGDSATQLSEGQTLIHLSLGQPALIEMLLDRGASIHTPNVDGESPLLYVVKHRPAAVDLMDYLLSKGADINLGDAMGMTPLMHAVVGHHPELIRRMLANTDFKVDINGRDKFGGTVFHWAVTCRQKSILDMLLAAEGVDVNATDGTGATALHRAATRGKLDILMHLLIQPSVDVNTADHRGNTALHCAVIHRELPCLNALLKRCSDDFVFANGVGGAAGATKDAGKKPAGKKGAAASDVPSSSNTRLDVDAVNAEGRTALQLAITVQRDTQMAAALLSAGASVNRAGEKGGTLLHSAVWAQSLEMTETLLSSGADASLRDDDDEAPLHIAARLGNYIIAKTILSHRATIDDQSMHHLRAPLHFACENCDKDMIALLLEHHANPSLADRLARTPLHLVCTFASKPGSQESEGEFEARRQRATESALLLIDHDAPIDVSDVGGWLPIHAACSADLEPVVARLIECGSPLNYADDRGWTPIHCAVAHGACASLKTLLDAMSRRGMRVDEELSRVDKLDRFPLMLAAEFGQKTAARILIAQRK